MPRAAHQCMTQQLDQISQRQGSCSTSDVTSVEFLPYINDFRSDEKDNFLTEALLMKHNGNLNINRSITLPSHGTSSNHEDNIDPDGNEPSLNTHDSDQTADLWRVYITQKYPLISEKDGEFVTSFSHRLGRRARELSILKTHHLKHASNATCTYHGMCIGVSKVTLADMLSENFDLAQLSSLGIQIPGKSTCPVCFKVERFTTFSHWKDHILRDITTPTCPWEGCDKLKAFGSYESFIKHECGPRPEKWLCPRKRCHRTYRSSHDLWRHLRLSHLCSKHSARALITDVEEDQSRRYLVCPFCAGGLLEKNERAAHLIEHMEDASLIILKFLSTGVGAFEPPTPAELPLEADRVELPGGYPSDGLVYRKKAYSPVTPLTSTTYLPLTSTAYSPVSSLTSFISLTEKSYLRKTVLYGVMNRARHRICDYRPGLVCHMPGVPLTYTDSSSSGIVQERPKAKRFLQKIEINQVDTESCENTFSMSSDNSFCLGADVYGEEEGEAPRVVQRAPPLRIMATQSLNQSLLVELPSEPIKETVLHRYLNSKGDNDEEQASEEFDFNAGGGFSRGIAQLDDTSGLKDDGDDSQEVHQTCQEIGPSRDSVGKRRATGPGDGDSVSSDHDDEDDDDDGDDDDDDPKRYYPRKMPRCLPRFACPYEVFYGNLGCLRKGGQNKHGGAADISRLKQHFNRRHKLSSRCHTCWAMFDTNKQAQDHRAQPFGCQQKSLPANERIMSPQEEDALNQPHQQSCDEDAWYHFFRILIPSERDRKTSWLKSQYRACK